jgi:predicted nuclease of predicted toxin-antitoxin system
MLLDAHLSWRVADALRSAGHDVRAADEERALDGWPDEDLLALATSEDRVLVTCDVKDFPEIARRWAEGTRPHAGCAILVGVDHGEFGAILAAIEGALAGRPDQTDWRDYTCFVGRPR